MGPDQGMDRLKRGSTSFDPISQRREAEIGTLLGRAFGRAVEPQAIRGKPTTVKKPPRSPREKPGNSLCLRLRSMGLQLTLRH